MAVLVTCLLGEPVLRETAIAIKNYKKPDLQESISDLIDTMRANELAGMSAPQINLKQRFTGVSREIKATGLLARVIQHEIDHLNGILFTDLADPQSFVSAKYYLENIRNTQY